MESITLYNRHDYRYIMKSQKNTSDEVEIKDEKDISKYLNKSSASTHVNQDMINHVDGFFAQMSEGDTVSNQDLVTFLEDKGIKITSAIKTDVAMNVVTRSKSYASGSEERIINKVKSNPKVTQSKWLYVRI